MKVRSTAVHEDMRTKVLDLKLTLRARRQLVRALLAFVLAGALTAAKLPIILAATEAALPSAVLRQVSTFHRIGKGSHSYFGLKVYHVTLWATSGRWNPEEPHALDLESNRAISKEQLAAAGMSEMIRLRVGTPHQLQAWRKEIERVLPSVNQGDQLVVFCAPNHKTFFFYNGNDRGEIDDPAFGAAFFSIWLDPRTKNLALRKSLLNH
ncbi:MAG: chalcone isomerase family protein [Candidatus Binataceae bacterium]